MKNKFLLLIFLASFLSLFSYAQQNRSFYSGPPVFHGATVVGNYRTTDFIFTVPATGERPISFSAENMPEGLKIDPLTGTITGKVYSPGEFKVTIKASNSKGKSERELTIDIGDRLALTPPMGWNSWNVFAWDINEDIVMKAADAMASNGMRDLGYQYINIDDYWQADERETDGRPKADPKKFPHGMKWLCDYVHSKGLKFGIYSCAGNKTCGKRFGSYKYEAIDAKTYADWGVDLLKYDYCFADQMPGAARHRYTAMGNALKNCGRSIVFSICEWGVHRPWKWGARVGGQYWRTTGDIYDDWDKSVMKILDKQNGLARYSNPGHWNDPDMLIVGNYGTGRATGGGGRHKGCTNTEYQSHMSLWCLLDAPLLASNDLSNMNESTYNILTNPEILDIDQDAHGLQAKRVTHFGDIDIYSKQLADGSLVIGILNRGNKATRYTLTYDELPGTSSSAYYARDLLERANLGNATSNITLNIESHEVKVLKLTR